MWYCPRCAYSSTRGHVRRHLKKNKKCIVKYINVERETILSNFDHHQREFIRLHTHNGELIAQEGVESVTNNVCCFCNEEFSTSSSMYRHRKHFCKVAKEQRERERIREEVREELRQEMLHSQASNVTINDNSQTTNNIDNSTHDNSMHDNSMHDNRQIINNNNYYLHGFEQEDTSDIPHREWLYFMGLKYNAIPALAKRVHSSPQNMNLYLSNSRSKKVHVFNAQSNEWNIKNLDFVLEMVLTHSADRLSDYAEKNKHIIPEDLYRMIDKVTSNVNKKDEDDEDYDPNRKSKKQYYDEIHDELLNIREKVKANYEKEFERPLRIG